MRVVAETLHEETVHSYMEYAGLEITADSAVLLQT